MQLITTAEQNELREALRRSQRDSPTVEAVRRSIATGGVTYDVDSWQRNCRQIGVAGLLVPETAGGAGAGLVDAAVAITELASALSGEPLLSTTIAIDTLGSESDDVDENELRAGLVAGTAAVGIALAPDVGNLAVDRSHVTGTLPYVLDAEDATTILALTPNGMAIIDPTAGGVKIERRAGLDLTRRVACVRLASARARLRPLSQDSVQRQIQRRGVLIAADALGLMQAMLYIVSEYAKIRIAFGRPIASFQAVKHQFAELFCTYELAQAIVVGAASELDVHGPEEHELALLAKRFVLPAAVDMTSELLRLMGGIGYTWEHDAHLYVRRAHADLALGGPQGLICDELATRLHLS